MTEERLSDGDYTQPFQAAPRRRTAPSDATVQRCCQRTLRQRQSPSTFFQPVSTS